MPRPAAASLPALPDNTPDRLEAVIATPRAEPLLLRNKQSHQNAHTTPRFPHTRGPRLHVTHTAL